MAEEVTELHYRPDRDAIWKEVIVSQIKNVKNWEVEWSFQVDRYKKLEEGTAKANVFSKSKEKVADIVDHPKIPTTSNGVIGWLANDRRFSLEIFGRHANPIREIYKNLEWPIEGCP
ncbi:uncharacterized protein CDAR_477551 [Caerostris darwini]|uniref:Uncharacterized protein n=1 Tax=Caerostris darwini TaxID=1538125 RepID=A0AAV4RTT1_9ARAC|nr:uncharacterized protein CDAR_477551 [Caerostris darwini]